MTDNIQIIENNDLNTLNKEILIFTILVTHFETQPCRRSFNTSQILKLVCYYAIIISRDVVNSSHANMASYHMVENGARCSDKNIKILVRY